MGLFALPPEMSIIGGVRRVPPVSFCCFCFLTVSRVAATPVQAIGLPGRVDDGQERRHPAVR